MRLQPSLFALALSLSVALPSSAAEVVKLKPLPITPAQNPSVVDERFGIKVVDEDRWLEDTKSPKVEQWYRDQNAYTRKVLDSMPGRAALQADFRKYEKATQSYVTMAAQAAGSSFFVMQSGSVDIASIYVTEDVNRSPRLLVDMTKWKTNKGALQTVEKLYPSPDGRKLAAGFMSDGIESMNLNVFDSETGNRIEAPVRGIYGLAWLPDSSGYIYSRPAEPVEDLESPEARPQIYLHVLGTAANAEKPLQDWQQVINGERVKEPRIYLVDNGRWVLGEDGPNLKARDVWATPFAALAEGKPTWRKVVDRGASRESLIGQEFYRYVVHEGVLYVTHTGSGGGSIESIDMQAVDSGFKSVLVAGDRPFREYAATREGLLLVRADGNGVTSSAFLMPWSARGTLKPLTVDRSDGVSILDEGDGKSAPLLLSAGWSSFVSMLRLHNAKLEATQLIKPPAGFDARELKSVVIEVPSHDGVLVPLSITMPAKIKLDGRNPLMLYGYGAYGYTADIPVLWPQNFQAARLGIVRATCHVRGGGERGETWHLAGQKANKANTWKDFIACADWLVAHRYTSPRLMRAQGGSAGGVLVGNAVIERPDLFGTAESSVGMLDATGFALRADNGKPNWPEFGDPASEDGWKSLVGMSVYNKLRPGMRLPPILLTVGWNDGRVPIWNSGKFVARARRMTQGTVPILMSARFDAGHGGTVSRDADVQSAIDSLSFYLWQIGDPAFQPRWTGP